MGPTIFTRARAPAREILRSNVISGRARENISQVELAERSGVSRVWISRIERGEAAPSIDIVERLAEALGVSIADLLTCIPIDASEVDDEEIARRAAAPDEEFVDARALINAIDEATAAPARRYSRRGRPAVSR